MGKPNVKKLAEKLDIEGLIKALEYKEDGEVRAKAAIALGLIGSELGDERVIEPLIEALGDVDDNVRVYATKYLGEMGEIAVEPLIKALRHSDWSVRGQAANALGGIGDKRALNPLKKLLKGAREVDIAHGVTIVAQLAISMIEDKTQR